MVVARRAGAAPAGERHLGALHGLVTVQRRLSALVGARGAEPRSVTALLAAELGLPAAVVGRDLTVLAASAPGVSDAEAADNVAARATPTAAAPDPWTRVLGAAAATGRALRVPGPGMRSHVVVGVLVADAVTSFLVVEEDRSARVRAADLDGDDLALLVAEQAATVLAVLAGRQQVLATAAGHVRGDLLSGLLLDRARHPGEAAQWAEHVGYDADVAHRVLLVVPRDDLGPLAGLLTEADDYLTTAVPGALSVVRDTEVAALVPDDADPVTVGSRCARRLARGRVPDPDAQWPVTVAVGGLARGVGDLARSYDQARRTSEAARRLGREGRVLRFDDLGVHRLRADGAPPPCRRPPGSSGPRGASPPARSARSAARRSSRAAAAACAGGQGSRGRRPPRPRPAPRTAGAPRRSARRSSARATRRRRPSRTR